ncbi:unnamed protein product [Sphagnum jensenii]|uniref:Uncharacterized protein n=1 Tax=Sphagnum jensenii TaxID=128206 RepID=A0ABP1B7E7_9BRYO
MIERFSKWLEFVPSPYHSNERITYAFLDMVFNRFGAQVEILIDKVSLSSFSPNFLLFGYEPKLPTSIQQDVMAIINMDDPNVWI